MPRETEPSANGALGGLVQGMMSGRRVRSENARAIVGRPGLQPDVLVTATERAPVVVEAEFEPARSVEAEAREQLPSGGGGADFAYFEGDGSEG